MNERHQRFVDEYTLDLCGAAAARRAGYSKARARQTAHDLLQRDDIQQAIAERQANIADRLGITAEYVLRGMRDLFEKAMQPTPKTYAGGVVKVDNEVVYEVDGSVAARALELMAKHRGMLTDRTTIEGDGVVFTLDLGELDAPPEEE